MVAAGPNTYWLRRKTHEAFRPQVLQALRDMGLQVFDAGVEQRSRALCEALVRCGDDTTARAIRHEPDAIVVNERKGRAYWCEIKTRKYPRPNLAYEIAAHKENLKEIALGRAIFTVFDNWTACWADVIRKDREIVSTGGLEHANGSRAPLLIFSERSDFLRPLGQFVREELLVGVASGECDE